MATTPSSLLTLEVCCWLSASCFSERVATFPALPPPHPNTHIMGLEHLVIPEPMAVRGWVVATCPNQSNLLCRLVIEAAHMPLISPVTVCLRSTHPTSTTDIPIVKDVAEAELFGTIRVTMSSLQRAVGPTRRIGAWSVRAASTHHLAFPLHFP